MIKQTMKKTVLALTLLSSSLMADYSDYMYNGYSLLSIEGGYSNLSADLTDVSETPDPYQQLNGNAYHAGLKIGAQTGHYRIFLSARMYQDSDDDFDYLTSYGIEGQYLFTMAKWADFYIGAGGGIVSAKYNISSEPYARTINDPYFSGEMGFNFHVSKGIDIELGGRYVSVDAANTQENEKEYRFNDIVTAYTSIVFKYKMD